MNCQVFAAAIALLALHVLCAEAGTIRSDGDRTGLSVDVACLVANVADLNSVLALLRSVEGDFSEVSETLDDIQPEASAANEKFLKNSLQDLANIVCAAVGESLGQRFAQQTPVRNVAEGSVAGSVKERKEGPVSATIKALTAFGNSVRDVLTQGLKAHRNEENTFIKAVKELQKNANIAFKVLRAQYKTVLEKFQETVDKAVKRAEEIITKVEQCVNGTVPNSSASSNSTMELN